MKTEAFTTYVLVQKSNIIISIFSMIFKGQFSIFDSFSYKNHVHSFSDSNNMQKSIVFEVYIYVPLIS